VLNKPLHPDRGLTQALIPRWPTVGRVAYTVVRLVTLDCTGVSSHCRHYFRYRQYECRRWIIRLKATQGACLLKKMRWAVQFVCSYLQTLHVTDAVVCNVRSHSTYAPHQLIDTNYRMAQIHRFTEAHEIVSVKD